MGHVIKPEEERQLVRKAVHRPYSSGFPAVWSLVVTVAYPAHHSLSAGLRNLTVASMGLRQ